MWPLQKILSIEGYLLQRTLALSIAIQLSAISLLNLHQAHSIHGQIYRTLNNLAGERTGVQPVAVKCTGLNVGKSFSLPNAIAHVLNVLFFFLYV